MSPGQHDSDGDGRVRKRVIVHGRVQDVWFRASTLKEARRAGVEGWVRNQLDGTVEAVFEGNPQAVARMIEFVRSGPDLAHVERVDVREEPVQSERGFSVR